MTEPLLLQHKPKAAPVRPAGPRTTWPRQGALTPSLLELYASAADTDATVVMPDGSELPAAAMALTPVVRQTRLASLMSDFGLPLPLLGVLPPPGAEDLAATPETLRTPAINALLQQVGTTPLALYNAVHTTIRPELYAGSKKGADATLREGARLRVELSPEECGGGWAATHSQIGEHLFRLDRRRIP